MLIRCHCKRINKLLADLAKPFGWAEQLAITCSFFNCQYLLSAEKKTIPAYKLLSVRM